MEFRLPTKSKIKKELVYLLGMEHFTGHLDDSNSVGFYKADGKNCRLQMGIDHDIGIINLLAK
jgi:hypothetical protein